MASENPISAVEPLDDLFDYDVGLDDLLHETPATSTDNATKPSSAPDNTGLVLGLDEEVKVSKKRQPVAKLDEARLLSQPGIPKLRHTAKRKLKFRGKGHEFSDMARLLNFYQLWLDDLYPRAKFADGLTIIEKLGHSKHLQTMRREWIEEEKPTRREDSLPYAVQMNQQNEPASTTDTSKHDSTGPDRPQGPDLDSLDQELFIPDENINENTRPVDDRELPQEDDLDALLREQEEEEGAQSNLTFPDKPQESRDVDRYDDDLDAMEELKMLGNVP